MFTDALNAPWFLAGPLVIILGGVMVVLALSLLAVFWPQGK